MSGHAPGVSPPHAEHFARFYAVHLDALLTYALRRVAEPADAADVVADSFLVAWRRVEDLPPGDEARLWLYGVARKVLANHRRGDLRRERLGTALRDRLAQGDGVPADAGDLALDVRAALAKLGELDREVLTLTIWEELTPSEIAGVLGISAAAVRTRLTRARGRLRQVLGDVQPAAGHVPGIRPALTSEEGS